MMNEISRKISHARRILGHGIPALFGALLALGLVTAPAAQASTVGSGLQMYVVANNTNPGTVTPFSLSTNSFGSAITAGDDPTNVILSPDGSTLYVLNYSGESISVIDTASGTLTKTFDLKTDGLFYPYPLVGTISPDGKTLYINDEYYDTYAINAQTGTLEATYGAGGEVYPYDVIMSPSGQHVLVVLYEGGAGSEGAVESIDTATGAVTTESIATLTPPSGDLPFTFPYFMAESPDSENLYLVGYPYDASTNSYDTGVAVLNRVSGQITQEFDFGSDGTHFLGQVVVSPNGAWLYVTNEKRSSTTGGVFLIHLTTGSIRPVIPLDYPYAEAVSPDGTRLYVDDYDLSTNQEAISVIDVNPASAHFATVLANVGNPDGATAIDMGLPAVYSDPAGITFEQSAGPVSGTVVPDVVNGTTCPLTYAITAQPSSGDLSFNGGSFSFTPTLGDLPAANPFSWTATPPATCTAAFAPNEVAPARGIVNFVWKPTFGGISQLALTAGQSSGTVSFNLFSSAPVSLTATSSDPAVVPPGSIDLSQNCIGSCTFTLTGGQAGASTVDLLATEPSGVTASTAFSVTVTAPASSSGGGVGGFGPWVLLGLLGVFLARRRWLTQA